MAHADEEINETCFFKNEQNRAFENTKSHDALFQSSKNCDRLLADLQQEQSLEDNYGINEMSSIKQEPRMQEYNDSNQFTQHSRPSLREFQKRSASVTGNGTDKIVRKSKTKKSKAATSIQSP